MSDSMRYTRVPGRSPLINPMRSSLWLGEDHLLLVTHSFIAENYRRFPFDAIQAITSTCTSRGRVYNIVLGSVAALLAITTALTALLSFPFALIPGLQLGVVLLLLLINLRRGPTCRTVLRTAVQTAELGSLSRLPNMRRVMSTLVNRIEAVQGRVGEDRLAELAATSLSGNAVGQQVAPIIPAPRASAAVAPVDTPAVYCRGRAHAVLFSAVIGVGFCSLAALSTSLFSLVAVLSVVLLLIVLGTGIGAGVAQFRSTMPVRLKVLVWLIPAYHLITLVVTIVVAIIYAVIHFSDGLGGEQLTRHIVYQAFALFDFAVSATAGGFGLIWLARYRREQGPMAAAGGAGDHE